MRTVPPVVHAVERGVRGVFGSRLQSVIAYGLRAYGDDSDHEPHPSGGPVHASHGRGDRSDHHDRGHGSHGDGAPLAQTLVVVDRIGRDDLRALAALVASWHEAGAATPLVLPANELARSLDAFPLEFAAIVADHVVVSGRDPFTEDTVDPSDVRRACEVQARSHLLHLREGYLETRGRGDALAVLIVSSAPAFAALLESVARLAGASVGDRFAAGRHVERLLGNQGSITEVAALADVTEISSHDAERLFPDYLAAVEHLVSYVDGWAGR